MQSNFKTVIIASACAFNIGMLSWWAQPLIIHSVIQGLSLTEPEAGLVVSIEIMAIALTAFVLAPRLNQLPIRKSCLIACVTAIFCHLLLVLTGTYTQLLVVRLFAGIAEGFVYSISVGIVASTADPDRGYGIINAVNIVYCSLFLAVVPNIEISQPHIGMFAALAFASLILTPFVRSLPEYVSINSQTSQDKLNGIDLRAWLLIIAMFAWGTGINIIWPFLLYIGSQTALEVKQIGIVLGSSGVAGFIGVILMTLVANRYGHLRPMLIGLTINLIAVVLITFMPTSFTYIAGVMLLMMAVYFILPYFMAIAAEADPTGRLAAAVVGMYMFTGGIGPVLGGNLVSRAGPEGIGLIFLGAWLLTIYLMCRFLRDD